MRRWWAGRLGSEERRIRARTWLAARQLAVCETGFTVTRPTDALSGCWPRFNGLLRVGRLVSGAGGTQRSRGAGVRSAGSATLTRRANREGDVSHASTHCRQGRGRDWRTWRRWGHIVLVEHLSGVKASRRRRCRGLR